MTAADVVVASQGGDLIDDTPVADPRREVEGIGGHLAASGEFSGGDEGLRAMAEDHSTPTLPVGGHKALGSVKGVERLLGLADPKQAGSAIFQQEPVGEGVGPRWIIGTVEGEQVLCLAEGIGARAAVANTSMHNRSGGGEPSAQPSYLARLGDDQRLSDGSDGGAAVPHLTVEKGHAAEDIGAQRRRMRTCVGAGGQSRPVGGCGDDVVTKPKGGQATGQAGGLCLDHREALLPVRTDGGAPQLPRGLEVLSGVPDACADRRRTVVALSSRVVALQQPDDPLRQVPLRICERGEQPTAVISIERPSDCGDGQASTEDTDSLEGVAPLHRILLLASSSG